MNKVFSQNIPDMKKYFESIKIRVNEINEDKNKNEDAVINRFKSKIKNLVFNFFPLY